MAMEPAAISASPATTTRRLLSTAPERPAARAKGTVSPSDMPMTTSRTTSPAVKWRSMCGVCGMVSQIGMLFDVLHGAPHHFTLSPVHQLPGSICQWQPERVPHFDPHLGRDVSHAPRAVEQQEEVDDLEDARAVAPGTDIEILDVSKLDNRVRLDAGFFADFANGCLERLLLGINGSLGQCQQHGK